MQVSLTDLHLISVAKHLADEMEVHTLGAHLQVHRDIIRRAINDNPKRTDMAALQVLHEFSDKEQSPKEAYQKLGEALVEAGLISVAKEALDFPPETERT